MKYKATKKTKVTMKTLIHFIKHVVFSIFSLFACSIFAQNLLNNPESVVYDSVGKYYLVSNKGNGKIIKIDSTGGQSVWQSDQNSIRGMHILNDCVYVCCDAGVVGYDLTNAEKINTIAIADRNFLNDITADSAGQIYASDSGNGKIYKVNPITKTYSIFASGLSGPNGLLCDEENSRLLVCHWGSNATIKAIQFVNGSVSLVKATSLSDLDGLAADSHGQIYVSSWRSNSIYRYDRQFSSGPVIVSAGHSGPADIYINKDTDILAVPNFNNNTVDFIPLAPTSIAEPEENSIKNFKLFQNYPNPFNSVTTIAYDLPKSSFLKLAIYDGNGRRIETLVHEYQNKGLYTIEWNTRNISSGVYFYRLETNEFNKTNQCLLIK